jgi:hypothetical protein
MLAAVKSYKASRKGTQNIFLNVFFFANRVRYYSFCSNTDEP